jgi:ABC-type phosphate/phosphonate transport system substrate-binding protein
VCYAESTASIWKGIMRHFGRQGLDVETVLFQSYERLCSALIQGSVHIAWNGPLAHVRLVRTTRGALLPLGMRDSDRDFETHVVVRDDARIARAADLAGRRVAAGTVDSPQAYVAPFAALAAAGVPLGSLTVTRFDRDVGKHGDTAHGETGVLAALRSGAAEAGFISDLMWRRFEAEGTTGGLHVLRTPDGCPPLVPRFDHCQFAALPSLGRGRAANFQDALLAMDGSGHAEDAATLKLEGVRERWLPARGGRVPRDARERAPDARAGYEAMIAALDAFGEPTVAWPGHLHTPRRHPFKHLVVDSALVRDSFGC